MRNIYFLLGSMLLLTLFVKAQSVEQIIAGTHQFGNDVAIDGEWAVVGNMWAPGTNPNIPQEYENVGLVKIYQQNVNGNWELHTTLSEPFWYPETNEQHGLNYGMSVDIDGEWIVVGANYDSDEDPLIGPDGVVFVYKYDEPNDMWLYHQKLSILDTDSIPHPVNNFGFSVSVTESLIVIGDPDYGAAFDQAFLGTVYIYELNAGNWNFTQQLMQLAGWASGGPISAGYGNRFGYAVSAWGNDRLIVGIPNEGVQFGGPNNTVGSAIIYEKPGAVWTQSMQFGWGNVKFFGFDVDIVDEMAIVGIPGANDWTGTNEFKGNATLINLVNGNWVFKRLPRHLGPYDQGDQYGHSVSLGKLANGNYIAAVGVPYYDGPGSSSPDVGHAVWYDIPMPYPEGEAWYPFSYLSSDDLAAGNEFGNAVALDKTGNTILVGSWMRDSDPGGFAEGAVSFFNLQAAFAGVWDGEEDEDWNNPTNWTDDNVPNGFTDVTIPAGSPNMPSLEGFGQCRNLTIEQGATVTLIGEFTFLNVSGDATINGEFIVPAGELNKLASLQVGGTTFLYCEKDKQLPGGTYNGEVTINASSTAHEARLAGDAIMLNGLAFGTTRGELEIRDNTLELHGLVSGYDLGLRTISTSNLILRGEPPIPFRMPQGVSTLNNLTVDNIEGVSHINTGNLTINGTLTLINGEFHVFTTGGVATLQLYNSVAGDPSLFKTDHESSIWIMGSNPGIQYPSGSTEVFGLVVNNPNEITLNNHLLVNSYLYLLSGGANANGNQVSFAAAGELWSAADITIDDGLFDLNNPPRKLHVAFGANILFDAVGAVEDIELGGFPVPAQLNHLLFTNQNQLIENNTSAATSLEVQAAKGITVSNQFIADGEFVLKSSINGNSSFIDNRNNPTDITATIENYLTSGQWHYVSPSVEQATAAAYYVENGSSIWMKEFNEATNQWEYISSLAHPLTPGKGYAIWVDPTRADETASYSGVLNNGDHMINLGYSGINNGWNFIGNPFPSSLDLREEGWNQFNTTSTVYVYDNGNYVSSNLLGNGTLEDGIIPPGQGFFVQAIASNATFLLPQTARVHSNKAFYKQSRNLSDAMIITVRKGDKRDKTWISFDPEASDAFDLGLDAWRLQGDAGMPQLYTRYGDRQLSINHLNELIGERSVPLYFHAAETGTYSLEVSHLESFSNASIMLEDQMTGTRINLKDQNQITFESIANAAPHRFTLHFNREVTGLESNKEGTNGIRITHHGNEIEISASNSFEGGVLQIYTMNGQLIQQLSYPKGNSIRTPIANYKNQMILIKLTEQKNTYTTRIFIP